MPNELPSILIATENDALNRHIKRLPWAEVAATAQYREAVADMVRTTKADTLLLSAYLKGSQDIVETVFTARSAGLRVVFLAGEIKADDDLIADLIAMGVYDILFNPISITQIEESLRVPGRFGDAVKLLRVAKKPEGRRVRSLANKFSARFPLPYEKEEQPIEESAQEHHARDCVDRQPQPMAQEQEESEEKILPIPQVPQEQLVATKQSHRQPLKPPKVLPKLFMPKPSVRPAPRLKNAGLLSRDATISSPSKAPQVRGQRLLVVPSPMAARIWLVVGAARRVGATSFALALTKLAAEMGLKVKVADGGGGASTWVKNSDLLIPGSAEFTAAPGEITIVDAGYSSDHTALTALAEAAVWVTDLAPGGLDVEPLISGRTFLVGTRKAPIRGLEELAEIRQVIPICSLPEAPKIKEAQLKGELPLPSNWRRELKRCLDILNVF